VYLYSNTIKPIMSDAPVILITGASSGIGAATARRFAQAGYRMVLAARRLERLQVLAEELRAIGRQVLPVATDMGKLEQIQQLVKATLAAYGRIDVLFNNAGFGCLDWLEELEPEHGVQELIQVNLTGTIWMAQAVLPTMLKQRSGHIINMSSVAGLVAPPTYTVYSATKFGMRGFTEALRREVRLFGIHVSGIYPGVVETEFTGHAGFHSRTGITSPGWLTLSACQVAEVVWRLVQRPRRALVIPWIYGPVYWLDTLFPGLVDWIVEAFYVRPERS
jgi:NADP-dependent 3-hydroxy acid dehydrogenase YdfG